MDHTTSILFNKRILVTGASGFVGRNLYEWLKDDSYDVVGTQHSKRENGLVICDLTKPEEVDEVLDGVDYIFMTATKTYGAGVCTKDPAALVKDNIVMNANILDACYRKNIEKVLFISSSVVYQDSFKPLAEEDLDLNKDPYPLYLGVGWVKRYTEQLCKFYNTLGLNVVTVRPTNIYGVYDKLDDKTSHFIPALIKRALAREHPFTVWGTGRNVKDLIYIDDFIRDILLIFESYNSVEPINVCSGELHTVAEVAEEILHCCGYDVAPFFDTTKPDSVPYKCLNKNKFNTLFGKQQYTELNYGISQTVEWLKRAM